ncbi:MAG TPA: EamA family transporter [Mycobacteriales bacterium]|nr:EamA family transporter [Mycobacteriales bacterium]
MAALLALLSSLLWGTADFVGGTATRRLPALVVVTVSQAVALACLVPLALLLGGDLAAVALPSLAAGVVGPLALLAFYRALAAGTMGVVAPVAALGVAVPVVAGLVAGESPSTVQLAGIAVASVGVVLACGPELQGAGRGGAAPLLLALAAAAGFGAVFVLLAEAAESSGGTDVPTVVASLVVMRCTSVVLLSAALLVARAARTPTGARQPVPVGGPAEPEPPPPGVSRRGLPLLAVVGVFDVGANGTFAVASQSDLVSVTAVLSSLYPVVTGLLAWRLHGERLAALQWAGVVLALTGVVLLAAG